MFDFDNLFYDGFDVFPGPFLVTFRGGEGDTAALVLI